MAVLRKAVTDDPETIVASVPADLRPPTTGCRCWRCTGGSSAPTPTCVRRTERRRQWLEDRGVDALTDVRASVALMHPNLIRGDV